MNTNDNKDLTNSPALLNEKQEITSTPSVPNPYLTPHEVIIPGHYTNDQQNTDFGNTELPSKRESVSEEKFPVSEMASAKETIVEISLDPFDKKKAKGWLANSDYSKKRRGEAIERSKKAGKGWAPIYNIIIKKNSFTPTEKLIFHTITKWGRDSKRGPRNRVCDLTLAQICEKTGIKDKKTVTKATQKFERLNYMEIQRLYDKTNLYYFDFDSNDRTTFLHEGKDIRLFTYEIVTGYFLEAPEHIFTVPQKAFICEIIPYTYADNTCRYSLNQLSLLLGFSKSTIQNRLTELERYITPLEKGFQIDLWAIMEVEY